MSEDTPDVISSQESPDGNLLSDLQNPELHPDITEIILASIKPHTPEWEKLFGPGVVHVSRFRARDADKALPTNVICGPLFSPSSPSADLQSSLVSKLVANLDLNGSVLFDLIWRALDMPVEPPICQLRASARHTKDKDSSGWLTPVADDSETRKAESAQKQIEAGRQATLAIQAVTAGWPTPDASERGAQKPEKTLADLKTPGAPMFTLESAVKIILSPWATPLAGEPNQDPEEVKARKKRRVEATGVNQGPSLPLGAMVHLTSPWGTPNARDHLALHPKDRDGSLPAQVASWATPTAPRKHDSDESAFRWNPNKKQDDPVMQILGRELNLSDVPMEKRGQLNPEFCRWLMGFPEEWGKSVPTVTR